MYAKLDKGYNERGLCEYRQCERSLALGLIAMACQHNARINSHCLTVPTGEKVRGRVP
jgi:hypothetical protein